MPPQRVRDNGHQTNLHHTIELEFMTGNVRLRHR